MYHSHMPIIPGLAEGNFLPPNSRYYGLSQVPRSNVLGSNLRAQIPIAPAQPGPPPAASVNGAQPQIPDWVFLVAGVGIAWWLTSK
jgi:hypothetical protein